MDVTDIQIKESLHKYELYCHKCNNFNCLKWYSKEKVYQCNICFTIFTISDIVNIDNIESDYTDCYEFDFHYEQLI